MTESDCILVVAMISYYIGETIEATFSYFILKLTDFVQQVCLVYSIVLSKMKSLKMDFLSHGF